MMRRLLLICLLSLFSALLLCSDGLAKSHHRAADGKAEYSTEEMLQWWRQLPVAEQQLIQQRHDDFSTLPAKKQHKIRRRWERLQQMSPQEQKQFRKRAEKWRQLPPEERKKLRKSFRRFKELPEAQQKALRLELKQLRELDLPRHEREQRRREIKERYFTEQKAASDAEETTEESD
ncbi:MAG: DUF3106 domain-containing protein [Desulfuromonadales bacterium]|nr:DUF3106 domain-containing protein [Desulfuromonadales bacterium]